MSHVRWLYVALAALVSLTPARLQAQSALSQFEGCVRPATGMVVPFKLDGQSPVLGRFTSHGDAWFTAGEMPGTLVGQGVIVLKTETGDTLVGLVRWDLAQVLGDQRAAMLRFNWRDSVRLQDGTSVMSTGRYAGKLPADMTAQGIIAILIGLLVPAAA